MATTTNGYQLSILHGCIVTTKTPLDLSKQSHKVAACIATHQSALPETVLLPHFPPAGRIIMGRYNETCNDLQILILSRLHFGYPHS